MSWLARRIDDECRFLASENRALRKANAEQRATIEVLHARLARAERELSEVRG